MGFNEIQILAVSIGLPAILSSVIPFLITRHYNLKDKKEDNKEDIKDLRVSVEEMKKQVEEYNVLLDKLVDADREIIRDRIIQMYNHYYKEKKYMPIYAKESLQSLYDKYDDLEGNGVVKRLVEEMYSLPTEFETLQ